MKSTLGLLLFSLFFSSVTSAKAFEEKKVRKVAQASDLYSFGGEVCVIYDYRPMIESAKGKPQNLFAIELKNANGGSVEKQYALSERRNIKAAFAKVMADVQKYIEAGRCSQIEVFYPSELKPDSPM